MTASGRQTLCEVPLALQLDFGGDDRVHLPLDHLPCRAVVRSLALALIDMTNARGSIKSGWTAKHYRNTISRFVRWLDTQDFAGELCDITVDHLYDWAEQENIHRERNLRLLLTAATPEAGVARPVSAQLRAHLTGRNLNSASKKRSEPLASYTHGEYERLVAACRSDIESWEAHRPAVLPSLFTTIAFRVLIGLELGIPSESVDALRLGDLDWTGARDLRVTFVKNRASGAQAMRYRATGPWSGPRLLERWIDASRPLREALTTDRIWVFGTTLSSARISKFSHIEWVRPRREFLRHHALRDDNGDILQLDMRRLRTTWSARKSKHWHGAVTIDPNRTARVEGDNYLTRTADLGEVDTIVESAQMDLLKRAETVALIVLDDNSLADDVDDLAIISERPRPEDADATWDMFAASCRNPFDSPFGPTGEFCSASVWSCLVCPLAIITTAKLPALLRVRDYLQGQSASQTHTEWLRIFGAAWVQLTTRILPRFSDAAVAQAREQMEADADLPVPFQLGQAP